MKYLLALFLLSPFTICAQSTHSFTNQIDSIFQSAFKPAQPGGAVLVVKYNKVVYSKGFGLADIKTKEAITAKTLFNLGSISKTFVAYGILRLASENKLSIDDDLFKYFPDFKNSAIAKKVKIFHLLTHSSGLPDNRQVRKDSVFYLTARDEENFAPLKQTEKLNFEPGTRFEYSNPAFNALALIIEKVSGKVWQQYLAEIIFKPSGMENSTITNGPHPQTGVSHGYILNGNNEFIEMDYGEEPTFAASGNGGVWSSVEELWKYEQAIQQYKFLDSQWINKSRSVYFLPDW
ncbi:MAG TPA: serine hydrolase domain-containing protein, partial [Chitinophagaceae bacterium]